MWSLLPYILYNLDFSLQLSKNIGPLTYEVWLVCIHVHLCSHLNLCCIHYWFQKCLVTCDKLIGKSTQEKCLLTEKHKVHHETDISHGFGLLTLLLVANSRHVHASWCWSTWSITQEYCQQLWRHQKAIVALQVGMDTYEKNEPKWATLLIVLRTQQLMSAERKEENGRHHIVYEKTC